MPNQPRDGNRGRVVRMEEALWEKVKDLATAENVKPSVIVRRAVEHYVNRKS